MTFGKIEVDWGINDLLPKKDSIMCGICGIELKSLQTHIIRVHKVSIDEYKERFGLNKNQSLISLKLSRKKSKVAKEQNAYKNFKAYFKKYSFKKGDERLAGKRNMRKQFKQEVIKNITENMTVDSINRRKNSLRKTALKLNLIDNLGDYAKPKKKRKHK